MSQELPTEIWLVVLKLSQNKNLAFTSKTLYSLWKYWLNLAKKQDIPFLLASKDIRVFLPRIERSLKYEHTHPSCELCTRTSDKSHLWLEPFLTPQRKRITFDSTTKKAHLAFLQGKLGYPIQECDSYYLSCFAEGAGAAQRPLIVDKNFRFGLGEEDDISSGMDITKQRYVLCFYRSSCSIEIIQTYLDFSFLCFVEMGKQANFKDFFSVIENSGDDERTRNTNVSQEEGLIFFFVFKFLEGCEDDEEYPEKDGEKTPEKIWNLFKKGVKNFYRIFNRNCG